MTLKDFILTNKVSKDEIELLYSELQPYWDKQKQDTEKREKELADLKQKYIDAAADYWVAYNKYNDVEGLTREKYVDMLNAILSSNHKFKVKRYTTKDFQPSKNAIDDAFDEFFKSIGL